MTLELTIQHLFDTYPTLFKERADCLNHLFCVIGNGYGWRDGELCYEFPDSAEEIEYLTSRLVDGKAHQYKKISLREEARLCEKKRIAEGWYEQFKGRYPDEDVGCFKQEWAGAISRLPDDVFYIISERAKRWYFYSDPPDGVCIDFCEDFAYLFNYPDDIRPDWKAGIEECRQLLIEDGYELPARNA